MNPIRKAVVSGAAAALASALIVASFSSAAAAPPSSTAKFAQAICKPGWRGTAVGQYGGVSFSVSCDNGRGSTRIADTAGTAYSIRMGVESATGAVDCFFSGDAARVQEACADVRLTIR